MSNIMDSDSHFLIDPVTRSITNASNYKKVSLMQYDHNSERFTFEIPKIVEGHDMSECAVRINYCNTAASDRSKYIGIYEVDDLAICPTDSSKMMFTWLISGNVTEHDGALSFLITFTCSEGDDVTYRWSSGINNAVTVSLGMNNGDPIIQENADILQQWWERLWTANGGLFDNNSGQPIQLYIGTEESWLAWDGDKTNVLFIPTNDILYSSVVECISDVASILAGTTAVPNADTAADAVNLTGSIGDDPIDLVFMPKNERPGQPRTARYAVNSELAERAQKAASGDGKTFTFGNGNGFGTENGAGYFELIDEETEDENGDSYTSLIPSVSDKMSLGSDSHKYKNIHAENFYGKVDGVQKVTNLYNVSLANWDSTSMLVRYNQSAYTSAISDDYIGKEVEIEFVVATVESVNNYGNNIVNYIQQLPRNKRKIVLPLFSATYNNDVNKDIMLHSEYALETIQTGIGDTLRLVSAHIYEDGLAVHVEPIEGRNTFKLAFNYRKTDYVLGRQLIYYITRIDVIE